MLIRVDRLVETEIALDAVTESGADSTTTIATIAKSQGTETTRGEFTFRSKLKLLMDESFDVLHCSPASALQLSLQSMLILFCAYIFQHSL